MTKQNKGTPTASRKQLVSAGEVCSIAIAKKYGFYDKDHYYNNDYTDVKTYSELDDKEGRDSNAVCKQTKDGKLAYPLCPLVYGVPYEQDPIDRSKCIVNIRNYCPSDMIKGERCKRSNVMLPAPVSMQTHCDEKITDWYMIPNYHLGNKYNFIQKKGDTEAQCMKPCPVDKMPGYTEDPVDNSSAGPLTDTEPTKCYNKSGYMGGKYEESENFCPIAWVYRLGQKQEDIADDIINKINESGSSNAYKKVSISVANNEAKQVYIDSKRLLENIDYPNDETLEACNSLITPERETKAYGICKDIYDNPKSIDNLNINPAQQKVLTKACHVLFCNENDDFITSIKDSTDPLCFPNIDDVDAEDMLLNDKNIDNQTNKNAVIDPPPKKAALNSTSKGKEALTLTITLSVVIPVVCILIFVIFKFRDKIKPLLLQVWCFLSYIWDSIVPWRNPTEREKYQSWCKKRLEEIKTEINNN